MKKAHEPGYYVATNTSLDNKIYDEALNCMKGIEDASVTNRYNPYPEARAGTSSKDDKKKRLNRKKGGDVDKRDLDIDIDHPGALHKELGIPKDKKIPMERLKKAKKRAERTDNDKLMKRVQFAINAPSWDKG